MITQSRQGRGIPDLNAPPTRALFRDRAPATARECVARLAPSQPAGSNLVRETAGNGDDSQPVSVRAESALPGSPSRAYLIDENC